MSRVRVGVIGAGAWGRNHVRAIAALPDAELAAVCDLRPAVRTQVEAAYPTAFMTGAGLSNRMNEDPRLGSTSNVAPNLVPASDGPAATGAATPPDDGFFDATATFVGAFEPGASSWAAGWTSFPAN
jgi:hypothetical protein